MTDKEQEDLAARAASGLTVPEKPKPGGAVSRYDPLAQVEQVWTSLDLTSQTGKVAYFEALGQTDLTSEEALNKPFATEHVLIHEATKVDQETGEAFSFPRTILIGPDRQTVAFCSLGVVRWLSRICVLFGKPPWKPALPLVVYPVKTAAGFRTFALKLEGEKDPATPRKRKDKDNGTA